MVAETGVSIGVLVMPRFVIKCPSCKVKIRWLAEDTDYPAECPKCSLPLASERADDDIPMPNILSFATRCTDGVYKLAERESEARMYAAAEMAGCPPSEMASLKITNMRDHLRPGDIAAMPVVNDVTRQMDALAVQGRPIGFGASDGIGFSAQVSQGAFPNMGARQQQAVVECHPTQAARAGLKSWNLQSSMPANEIVNNPNYRSRI